MFSFSFPNFLRNFQIDFWISLLYFQKVHTIQNIMQCMNAQSCS
jgi:hypothetical protein